MTEGPPYWFAQAKRPQGKLGSREGKGVILKDVGLKYSAQKVQPNISQ